MDNQPPDPGGGSVINCSLDTFSQTPQKDSAINDVVGAIKETGLNPMALVCDQGSTFRTCLKSFQADTKRESSPNNIPEDHKISINGHKLNIIFDPPHLIKGIRNNFLNKDLSFCGKTAQWNDIIAVYNADCQLGDIRMLHKITNDHIQPTTSQKMKTCTQVLSERMSAMLAYTSNYRPDLSCCCVPKPDDDIHKKQIQGNAACSLQGGGDGGAHIKFSVSEDSWFTGNWHRIGVLLPGGL